MHSVTKSATLEIFIPFPAEVESQIVAAEQRIEESLAWLAKSAQPFSLRVFLEFLPCIVQFEQTIDSEAIKKEFARKAKKLDLTYDGSVAWQTEKKGFALYYYTKKIITEMISSLVTASVC